MSSVSTADGAPLSLKVPAAAKKLDVSEPTVWRMIRSGRLRAVRIGRNTLIPYAQLVALVEGGATLDGGQT